VLFDGKAYIELDDGYRGQAPSVWTKADSVTIRYRPTDRRPRDERWNVTAGGGSCSQSCVRSATAVSVLLRSTCSTRIRALQVGSVAA
jgi:hypothetical protein